ncbi:MAG TPA: hypothetical protein VML55_16035 [Planctomycetaceae bacterium]|nr:hypothetical protein [Planctomycetaceae bacterium]
MRRNFLLLAALAFGGLALGPAVRPAPACPMCGQANETEDRRPQAYQASILFMMSMPALIAAGFGVGFYRLSRKAAALAAEQTAELDDEPRVPERGSAGDDDRPA